MRHQAFGVEIELKGLDREGAARAVARALGGAALGDRVTDPATGRTWKAVRDGSLHGVSAEGLGLKGDEFKTARKHLTANLSGNSAWRYNQGGPRRTGEQTEAPAPRPADHEPNTIHLENRNDDHFKFYRIEWNGSLVVRTTWGRIGTGGRSKEERFEDEPAMRAGVEATLQTRLQHGYTVISDTRQGR